MKVIGMILKIVAALAAIAGIVYVVATYGDKIVAWAKNLLGRCGCLCDCACTCEDDCENCNCEDDCDQCGCECTCNCEETAQEAPAEESAAVAEEADFQA